MRSAGRDLTLSDLFRHNCAHYPFKPALRIDGEEFTHARLLSFVDELVEVLRPLAAEGDRVGLWLPNSVEWFASFLALSALGAVSVPVSTRLTAEEMRGILSDAGATVLVTSPSYRGRDFEIEALDAYSGAKEAPAIVAATRDGPRSWRVAPARSDGRRGESPVPAGVFCIQYTSGTTSFPKGVLITQDSYIRTASYVACCQRVTPSSSFFSAAPFFHCSGSMHAITVCLIGGCTLNSFSKWDPEFVLDQIWRHAGDVSHGLFFRDVLELPPASWAKLASLKVGHDLGTREYLGRLHDDLGITGISNLYGMSETSGQFTMWFPDDPLDKRLEANGRPQAGNRLRIADPASGADVAAGKAGEIQMRGPTLTGGYFGRPEENARAFTADGWFRSGDMGYLTEEGELVFLSRLKDIIRIGGENVAPAEIEEAVRVNCGFADVAVVGVPHERLGEVPALVLPVPPSLSPDEIRSRLRGRLADFKIPQDIYVSAGFPLTSTNKIQKVVLKDWILTGKATRLG